MYKYIERGRKGIINSKWNGKELEREKINREDREDKIEEIKNFFNLVARTPLPSY